MRRRYIANLEELKQLVDLGVGIRDTTFDASIWGKNKIWSLRGINSAIAKLDGATVSKWIANKELYVEVE